MVILYGGKIRAEGTCDELLESHDRTTIEADSLDDETIGEIDKLIRMRSGGANAVGKVSRPRQKLEELFIGIVEQARAERVETHGAQHGGVTAAFLKGDEASGEELISKLLRPEEPVGNVVVREPETVKQAGPDKGVIGDLLGKGGKQEKDGAAPARPTGSKLPVPPSSSPTQNVDQSVIGSLLGNQEKPPAERGGSRGTKK
jgi:hypothetical protein